MTAKQQLLERVQRLSEDEAEQLLRQMPADLVAIGAHQSLLELMDEITEIFSDVPGEVWDALPSSDELDEKIYGTKPRSE